MRAAVVYESSFGNTRRIAEAIARELGATVAEASEEPLPVDELDLLVVGAPTHVHGLPTFTSRRSAHESGAAEVEGSGIRGFLDHLPRRPGLAAAAFDTRIDKPVLLTGSAARTIARRLRRRGCRLVQPPESFFVEATEGPLAGGEAERAAAWARTLA